MPIPGNAQEFLSVVEKSGLLRQTELEDYRFRTTADPSPPDRVAKWMLMEGRLTPFQVGLLLAGKSRPFFVGPYKVLSRIGNGSMGVVYLCEHRETHSRAAVKVLQNRRVADEVALERFQREARAAAALNHPNVVHAVGFGRDNHVHYLAMEYIDGRSLKDCVRAEGPLPAAQAAEYLRQAALGVQYAHEAGLIHRDIKPSNLMIDRQGTVKLLDLGLARFSESDIDLTRGAPLGSMVYTAPEQALDSHAVDVRADIYSLGATFYFAITGRPPVAGAGIGETAPPETSDPEDFQRLLTILRRMTAVSPAARYGSASEVAAELSQWLVKPEIAVSVTESPAVEPEVVPEATAVEEPGDDEADALLLPQETEAEPSFTAFSATPSRVIAPRRSQAVVPAKPAWVVRNWKPLIFALAAALGLLAAIATRGTRSANHPAAEQAIPEGR
jgi:serine/threonine protein kinase